MSSAGSSPRQGAHATIRQSRLNRLDWLLLIIVLALAIFFRLWQQGQVPPGFNFDEAYESWEAYRLLTEPGYHPIYFTGNWGITPLQIYLTALAYLIAGEQMLAIRYVSALAGILTIPALYVLARSLFPVSPGAPDDAQLRNWGVTTTARRFLPFVACVMLAVSPWHNAFSREGVEVALVPLWSTLAVLFLWRGLGSQSWWPFVLSGVFWGSAFYTYRAAWVLPGMVALFLLYKTIQQRGFLRRYGARLLLTALTAALVLLPLVVFAVRYPHLIVGRVGSVSVAGQAGGAEAFIRGVLENFVKVAGVFVLGGTAPDGNLIDVRPPMPLIVALLFYGGMVLALLRFKRPEYALLLIWAVWMWVPSVLSDDAPSLHRMIGTLPPVTVLNALGVGWLLDMARAGMQRLAGVRRFAPALAGLVLGILLIYTTVWSYQFLFVDWGRSKNMYYIFDVGPNEIGEYAASMPPTTRLYYTPADQTTVDHYPAVWHLRDRQLRTFNGRRGLVLAPAAPQGTLYLIKLSQGDVWTLPALRAFYPASQVAREALDPYGQVHSLAFKVEPNTEPVINPRLAVTADFQGQIRLLGADTSADDLHAGESLELTLYWQAESTPVPRDYTVFTHLLGPVNSASGSPLWAGSDSPPLGNSYPTTRWENGEVIVDRYELVLPPDAPAAAYLIEIGLYDPAREGVRLAVLNADGSPVDDKVILGSIAVR